MSSNINVQQRTQRIHVSSPSGAVTVENSGPVGPGGPLTDLIRVGSGSPEGSESAPVGTLYLNQTGVAGTTLYVKESGTGNTGWAAK
jgi:hypothetical protein